MTDQADSTVVASSQAVAKTPKATSKSAKPKAARVKTVGSMKKPTLASKAKPKSHPKYIDMVIKAIGELKERNGSSKQAILKHLSKNFNKGVGGVNNTALKAALKAGLAKKQLSSKGKGLSGKFKVVHVEKTKAKATVKKPASPSKVAVAKAAKRKPKTVGSIKKAASVKKESPTKKVTKKLTKPATAKPMPTKKEGVTKKKLPVKAKKVTSAKKPAAPKAPTKKAVK